MYTVSKSRPEQLISGLCALSWRHMATSIISTELEVALFLL